MLERSDNENDFEIPNVVLDCICGDCFRKHEGVLSEYLDNETDEDHYFCSKGCEKEACLQYLDNQDRKFGKV